MNTCFQDVESSERLEVNLDAVTPLMSSIYTSEDVGEWVPGDEIMISSDASARGTIGVGFEIELLLESGFYDC